MPLDVCRELFIHGSQTADIAVVEGQFDSATPGITTGGSLDRLCQWLDLPQLAIVNVSSLDPCQTLRLPPGVDGLLLDEVEDAAHLCRVQTQLESIHGVPVFGALDRLPSLRTIAANLASNSGPTAELCQALGNALRPRLRLDRLYKLGARRSLSNVESGLFRQRQSYRPLHIAMAFDDAFRSYFPDTLDVLESQGATVSVFSPLSSDSLPTDTDVVYLGCGQVEQYVHQLADNFCIKEALWNHVLSGKRVYAEGAGLAYLCRELIMPCGRHLSMVGVLPALARYNHAAPTVRPLEVTVSKGSWMFSANDRVRGYLSSRWIIHPDGSLNPLVSEAEHSHDLVGDYRIVGSRLHLNFAALPQLASNFFEPRERIHLNPVG